MSRAATNDYFDHQLCRVHILHDCSPDFPLANSFWRSLAKASDQRQKGVCLVLDRYVGTVQRRSPWDSLMHRRRLKNITHAKYLDLSVSPNPVVWNVLWLAMRVATRYSQSQDTGWGETRGRSCNTCNMTTSTSIATRKVPWSAWTWEVEKNLVELWQEY